MRSNAEGINGKPPVLGGFLPTHLLFYLKVGQEHRNQ
jgi:hypothetical protein